MKTKIIIMMILIVLFTIFVTQNTLVIPVDIFFWRVEMSVIVLISLCMLVGVLIGFIASGIFRSSTPKEAAKQNKSISGTKSIN